MRKILALALAAGLIMAGSALAQTVSYGDPNVTSNNPADNADHWRMGQPLVNLQIATQDVKYEFDGSRLNIPFTLNGSRATVYLVVYTKGANPQYAGGLGNGGPGGAVLRASGLDTMIFVSDGQLFPEGDNVITWDGVDWGGNPAGAGDYEFFLFGINDVDNPSHISSTGNVWTEFGWDNQSDPQVLWWTPGGAGGGIHKTILGTNFGENPGSEEVFDIPWMNERRGGIEGTFWDIGSYNVDPTDPNIHYATNYENEADTPEGTSSTGIWRLRYDPGAGTILPDEDWGGDTDRGWLVHEERLPNNAMTADARHPWQGDDGFLYVGWRDCCHEPLTPGILKIDRAGGEVADIIDMTDIYVVEQADGSFSVDGPFGIDIDERGFYTTGYWQRPGSFPASVTLEGDILWYNTNGDGFGDRYTDDEAAALGLDQPTGMMAIHNTVGKFHMAMAAGMSKPYNAVVYGPDGAGLLKLVTPKRATGITGETWWHATEDHTAGLYYSSAQGQQLHIPYDVEHGFISEGVQTVVEEVAAAALPTSYELKDNYPNPFNPETTIEFSIPDLGKAIPVTLTVYNTAGQEVARLADEELDAGFYKSTWDGLNAQGQPVGSGVYLYTLQIGQEFTESKQMTLLK